MEGKGSITPTQVEVTIDPPSISINTQLTPQKLSITTATTTTVSKQASSSSILTRFHAGYFRISLSLSAQALMWKTLGNPITADENNYDPVHSSTILSRLPPTAFTLLWSTAFFTQLTLSLLYTLKCFFYFNLVKTEFLHHVGVNYLFVPWISWLLLLQSAPFIAPTSTVYLVLWWVFTIPLVLLDVKIYGQWFTKGKRFLSAVANPTSQVSVIGNLVSALAAAQMGCRETALCMFSLGMAHYLVLFVTLYQRLSSVGDGLPAMLRPVFFLFIAAPSVASLAWDAIAGSFDTASKMLFFLSLFLFASLASRPSLFKKSMKRFNVAWWAYSFPLTSLAMASTQYARQVKGGIAHTLMLLLSVISVLVFFALIVITVVKKNLLFSDNDSVLISPLKRRHVSHNISSS